MRKQLLSAASEYILFFIHSLNLKSQTAENCYCLQCIDIYLTDVGNMDTYNMYHCCLNQCSYLDFIKHKMCILLLNMNFVLSCTDSH